MVLPLTPPIDPMLAKLTREIPDRDDCSYEPKWDGFRCIVFRDGDDLYLQSRNAKPLLRYFPEMVAPLLAHLPEQCVLDGELVIVGADGALDFDALQLRQHPAASRINKLAAEIPATYVAFDLLALGEESWMDRPFEERRAELVRVLDGARAQGAPIVVTPATRDVRVAQEWFEHFEGAGFDGVMLKPVGDPYAPGKRTLLKVKHERTCDCAVAGFRIHKDGDGVGSLLLGLYDDAGALHHVGVAAAIDAKTRTRLLGELEPFRTDALVDHPWHDWAEFVSEAREAGTRLPGGFSRWNAQKDMSWEPLRVELVAEVAFEGMLNGRFRHNARFRHLRSDRDPASCTFGQLDVVPPAELRELFG